MSLEHGYIDKYNSNDWLNPIGERANEVFLDYPRTEAIKIANAILIDEDSGDKNTPWAVIFPSDDLDEACDRLLEVLRTPDGQTPFYAPELQLGIREIQRIMGEEGALAGRFLACHAAYHLVRVAAGKPEEHFRTYRDLARSWPQYAECPGNWESELEKQFGPLRVRKAFFKKPELANILRHTAFVAKLREGSTLQEEEEPTPHFIARMLGNIPDGLGIEEASKLLELRLVDYRKAAYQLRGIPLL